MGAKSDSGVGGMGEGKPSLRWGVEQKLQFIEFRLFWEGHVNRSDLVEKFGVSVNQASGDLNRYIALAPDNMLYDKSGKTYVRSSSFEPLFLKPDATHYLSQVRSIAEGIVTQADAWIGIRRGRVPLSTGAGSANRHVPRLLACQSGTAT